MASNAGNSEVAFSTFYTEVKEIEKRDSVLTPKQQIDRLLRPGSSYFNLNPYEVLQVEPEAELEDVKKKYRRYVGVLCQNDLLVSYTVCKCAL